MDTALKIEKFLDHLIMDVIKIKPIANIAFDQELQKGFVLLKPFWNTKIYTRTVKFVVADELSEPELEAFFNEETPRGNKAEFLAQKLGVDTSKLVVKKNAESLAAGLDKILAGETEVTFFLSDVTKNHPDVAIVKPEKTYVSASSRMNPQHCQYIIHEMFITYDELVQNVNNKGWSREALDTIDYTKTVDLEQIDVTKSQREGIDLINNQDLIRIWECHCYWDLNGDGKEEKCIITISPDFDLKLRAIELPFHSYDFPFVKLFYELTDDSWYSHRGIPELIEDLVKEIDTQHMQRIDSQALRNTPQFLFRAGQVKGKSKNFGFARGIPVSGHQALKDIIAPFNATNTNAEFSYKDEQQILETKIADLIGRVNFGLQSQINKRQPRTEGEVQMHVQSTQPTFNLDMDTQRQAFEELFTWIYNLWAQFGDDQYEFNYFGQDKNAQGQAPERIRISREEIQGKYTIKVRANDQNINPQLRQQKASLVLQDTYAAFSAGLAAPEAVIAARKEAMQQLGVDNWEQFIQPPQPQPPKPPIQPIVIQMEDLTNDERSQVLANIGIKPDKTGRFINRQKEDNQQEFENTVQITDQLIKSEKNRATATKKGA
jgi:hypothetical protein